MSLSTEAAQRGTIKHYAEDFFGGSQPPTQPTQPVLTYHVAPRSQPQPTQLTGEELCSALTLSQGEEGTYAEPPCTIQQSSRPTSTAYGTKGQITLTQVYRGRGPPRKKQRCRSIEHEVATVPRYAQDDAAGESQSFETTQEWNGDFGPTPDGINNFSEPIDSAAAATSFDKQFGTDTNGGAEWDRDEILDELFANGDLQNSDEHWNAAWQFARSGRTLESLNPPNVIYGEAISIRLKLPAPLASGSPAGYHEVKEGDYVHVTDPARSQEQILVKVVGFVFRPSSVPSSPECVLRGFRVVGGEETVLRRPISSGALVLAETSKPQEWNASSITATTVEAGVVKWRYNDDSHDFQANTDSQRRASLAAISPREDFQRAVFVHPNSGDKCLSVMDLCCGCGGLSEGLSKARVDGVDLRLLPCVGCDLNYDALDTMKQRFRPQNREFTTYHSSLEELYEGLLNGRLRNALPLNCTPGRLGVLCCGLPCQGYSGANPRNHRNGGYTDARNQLFDTYAKIVDHLQPKIVLVEEVPEFAGSGDCAKLVHHLVELGYQCRVRVCQAGYYGAAQSRVRLFLICTKYFIPLPEAPAPTHAFARQGASTATLGSNKPLTLNAFKKVNKEGDGILVTPNKGAPLLLQATIKDWIGHLPRPAQGYGIERSLPECEVANHWCKQLGPGLDRSRVLELKPGQSAKDLPPELMQGVNGDWARKGLGKFRRLEWKGVFDTITATPPNPSTWACIHPHRNGILTVRECAAAQTFPDDFVFYANKKNKRDAKIAAQYQMVGNAVPPVLGEAWGKEILRAVSKLYYT